MKKLFSYLLLATLVLVLLGTISCDNAPPQEGDVITLDDANDGGGE